MARASAKTKAKTKINRTKIDSRPKVRSAKARMASPARKSAPAKRSAQKPIELHYWPTPNGWKISIMLEECGLPYVVRPVAISKGEQFKPEFLAISPNNRIPAIVDPGGPGGKPLSIFESGAILQYLGRKSGKFYPADERGRAEVDQWLFWQVANLGPVSGHNNHFRNYCPEKIPYALTRFGDEINRLYGVMNTRLKDRDFLAGKYSIADMACVGWVNGYERQGQDINGFPKLRAWLDRVKARPAVKRGMEVGAELRRQPTDMMDPQVRAVLFNQRAR
jgi:GST-like protein